MSAACGAAHRPHSTSQQPEVEVTRYLLTAALAAVALGSRAGAQQAQPAPSAKLNDATIVAIFDAANTYDIETGALAARKAHAQDVRDFGRMLEHDHRAVRQQ